jgi:hypothetical protein
MNLDEVFVPQSVLGRRFGRDILAIIRGMSYQVPIHEVAVTVALLGTDAAEHFVYLHPTSERRQGAETMDDYLNGGRSFFPMMCGGVPKLVNRDQILWVRFERLPQIAESEITIVEKLTILELTDGSRIEGTVPIDRPLERARLSDVLNDPAEAFLRIDDEEDTYYVNKHFIRVLIPR